MKSFHQSKPKLRSFSFWVHHLLWYLESQHLDLTFIQFSAGRIRFSRNLIMANWENLSGFAFPNFVTHDSESICVSIGSFITQLRSKIISIKFNFPLSYFGNSIFTVEFSIIININISILLRNEKTYDSMSLLQVCLVESLKGHCAVNVLSIRFDDQSYNSCFSTDSSWNHALPALHTTDTLRKGFIILDHFFIV